MKPTDARPAPLDSGPEKIREASEIATPSCRTPIESVAKPVPTREPTLSSCVPSKSCIVGY